MADSQKRGKGGGARKYGQNRRKCDAYKARHNMSQTAKARRILRSLRKGQVQPGWTISQVNKDRVVKT